MSCAGVEVTPACAVVEWYTLLPVEFQNEDSWNNEAGNDYAIVPSINAGSIPASAITYWRYDEPYAI